MWRPTSCATDNYNCIAWALGIQDRGLWPSEVWEWPRRIPAVVTTQEFIDVFEMFGYEICSSWIFESGCEKVILYERAGEVTHAARQLQDGMWTSKLGAGIDIVHQGLVDFPPDPPYYSCTIYGAAAIFLKRRLDGQHPDYEAVIASQCSVPPQANQSSIQLGTSY